MKDYPDWVCAECGNKAQPDKSRIFILSTWHKGRCHVCGKEAVVTQPRDFGYPKFKQEGE